MLFIARRTHHLSYLQIQQWKLSLQPRLKLNFYLTLFAIAWWIVDVLIVSLFVCLIYLIHSALGARNKLIHTLFRHLLLKTQCNEGMRLMSTWNVINFSRFVSCYITNACAFGLNRKIFPRTGETVESWTWKLNLIKILTNFDTVKSNAKGK